MPYDVMDAMLIMALHSQQNHSVKEFKRIAYKLSKKATPACVRGVMSDLQVSDSPVTTLFFHIDQFTSLLECCSAISQMGAEYIGMVIFENEAYPIKTVFQADTFEEQCDDAEWLLQNEMLVATRAVQQTMRGLQLERITCKVLLFNNRGFSGIMRPFVNVGREVWT